MVKRITAVLLCVMLLLTSGGVASAALSPEQKALFKSGVHWYDISDSCSGSGGDTVLVKLTGSDNMERAFNFLVEKGLTQMQAAAIVGNLIQESSVSPTAVNKSSGAYGIAQWLGGRYDRLKDHAGANYNTLAGQLDFLWYEVTEGTEKNDGALDGIKNAANIADATEAWELKFERAGTNEAAIATRVSNARSVLLKYGDGTESASGNLSDGNSTCPAISGGLYAMTFNVLGKGAPSGHGPQEKSWQVRTDAAAGVVKDKIAAGQTPGIIGFQEMQDVQFDRIKPQLVTAGYASWPVKRNADNTKDAYVRSIFYNKSMFDFVKGGTFSIIKNGSRRWHPWVELKAKSSGKIMYAFNLHTGQKAGHAKERARETRDMVASIKEHVPPDTPVITFGDYNSIDSVSAKDSDISSVSETPFGIMKSSGFDDSLKLAKTKVNGAYNTQRSTGPGTGFKKGDWKIDHVFVSTGITVNSWEVILSDNSKQASDHLPVIVSLNIPGISDAGGADNGNSIASTGGDTGSWGWPIKKGDYKAVSKCYSKSSSNGITIPVSSGTAVYAARKGTVFAVKDSGSDQYVVVKHEDGLYSTYQYLKSVSVKKGDDVSSSTKIGKSGTIGSKSGLRFTITPSSKLDSIDNNEKVNTYDPLDYLPHDRDLGVCSE